LCATDLIHKPSHIRFKNTPITAASTKASLFVIEKANRDPSARCYGQTTSCTTCARSDSDGATRHNARTLRAAPQRMAAPLNRDKVTW